jgi:glyoxylase-like metal-dependent hydrolase (beta-lactamase superfamily II)
MKSFPPHITNSLQVAARPLMARTTMIRASKLADCGKKLCTYQPQSGNNAAFSTQTSSGYPSLGSTDRYASSSRALACKQSPLYHHPTKNPQNTLKTQTSYSTKASVHGESIIHDVFEEQTGTWQYVIADPSTLMAVIIDPVLDYDRATQTITTQAADGLLSIVKENSYTVTMILETHAHADHLTAASYLQHRLSQDQGHRPAIGIGKRIKGVQKLFGERYGIAAEEYEGVFDKLFDDDETFNIGNITATVVHLPGHTPDHLGYKIGGKSSHICLYLT